MYRRAFVTAASATPAVGWFGSAPTSAHTAEPAPTFTWRRFEITTRVTLQNSSGPARLWLPLAQTAAGYQVSIAVDWKSNGRTELVRDATYGAQIVRCTWEDDATPQQIEVTQHVATRERAALPSVPLSQAERRFWTASTDSAPTDGIVRATVERIVAGRTDPHDRLRAIYDWVIDTTWRNPDTPGCGLGDIKAMLESNNFGGKCADINGLMVGLARATGIPARDVYGIRVANSACFPRSERAVILAGRSTAALRPTWRMLAGSQ